jgi:hypothetical protein
MNDEDGDAEDRDKLVYEDRKDEDETHEVPVALPLPIILSLEITRDTKIETVRFPDNTTMFIHRRLYTRSGNRNWQDQVERLLILAGNIPIMCKHGPIEQLSSLVTKNNRHNNMLVWIKDAQSVNEKNTTILAFAVLACKVRLEEQVGHSSTKHIPSQAADTWTITLICATTTLNYTKLLRRVVGMAYAEGKAEHLDAIINRNAREWVDAMLEMDFVARPGTMKMLTMPMFPSLPSDDHEHPEEPEYTGSPENINQDLENPEDPIADDQGTPLERFNRKYGTQLNAQWQLLHNGQDCTANMLKYLPGVLYNTEPNPINTFWLTLFSNAAGMVDRASLLEVDPIITSCGLVSAGPDESRMFKTKYECVKSAFGRANSSTGGGNGWTGGGKGGGGGFYAPTIINIAGRVGAEDSSRNSSRSSMAVLSESLVSSGKGSRSSGSAKRQRQ